MDLLNFLAKQAPLINAEVEYQEVSVALMKRHNAIMKKTDILEDLLKNGSITQKYFRAEMRKFQDEYKEIMAEEMTYRAKKEKLEKQLFESDSSLPPDFSHECRINNLGKCLNIYHSPSRMIQAKKDGGDSLTGYIVWPSAEELAKYLDESCAKNSWIRGRKIVDLGAGTGFLSIVAACLGGDVTATDLPPMIPFIEKNIDENSGQLQGTGGKIRTQILRWGDVKAAKSLPTPDIIFLTDVIYNETLVDPLISTVVTLSNKTTMLFISQEKHLHMMTSSSSWEMFYSQASKYFKFSPVPNYDNEKFWLFQGTLK